MEISFGRKKLFKKFEIMSLIMGWIFFKTHHSKNICKNIIIIIITYDKFYTCIAYIYVHIFIMLFYLIELTFNYCYNFYCLHVNVL